MNKCFSFISALIMTVGLSWAQPAVAQSGAGFQPKDMDLNYQPGTDFYRYVNGGWLKAHPLTPEYSIFGTFNLLHETNQVQLRTLIEGLSAQQNRRGSLEQKVGDLFALVMDSTRRNAEGAQPVMADLKRIGETKTKQELFALTARLARKGVPALFNVYVDADLRNSRENLVCIHQGGLTLGAGYYKSGKKNMVRVRKAYKEYIIKVFMLVGFDRATAETKAKEVLNIETDLSRSHHSGVKMRDVEANYHKMTYEQLLTDYPRIDWKTWFAGLGYPTFSHINVGQPKALKAVERVLTRESLPALQAYAQFKLINTAAEALDDTFSAAAFELFGKTMRGQQEQRPRWKRAVTVVDDVLGMAVGKVYVDQYFPEAAKTRMLALVDNLKTALGQRIDLQSWMDAETKKKAHEKLNTFYVKIGYPDTWKDYSALDIDPSLSYWENLTRASEFELADEIARKVNKPVDRTEWHMNPQEVNAYYNPTTNEICFPAGILQPPFFDMNADDATNYGAIGVVIGHEMTHGFDDEGSKFDKDGNLVEWWTKEDTKRFNKRTKVMVKYFDKIKVLPDLRANGKFTLGENIADHGGLKVAFQAFQNIQGQTSAPLVQGFTPEQRFFLAYAHLWAQNIREEQIRVYTNGDPHSLGEWRVNGALPHIDAWYKAFDIKPSAPLFVPKAKRVDIW